jgi:Gpi18-like mannosyltransferase
VDPRARAAILDFLRDVAYPFALTRLVLVAVAMLASAALPISPWVPRDWARPVIAPALDAFARWDGLHYVGIAANGYSAADPESAAFFPLYPLAMRAVAALFGGPTPQVLEVAGILISNACLLAAAVLLISLARLDFGRDVATRATWCLFVFPASFFLSAIYAESLFLALSLGSMLAARRERWLLAGLLAGGAALTRPFGFVIAVPLAVEALVQWRAGGRPWRAVLGLAAIPLAVGAHISFLAGQYGDPLIFLHVEQEWHRHLMAPWDTFRLFLEQPITVNTGQHSAVDLVVALLTIAVALGAWRLLRPSYALYLSVLVLIPLSSGSLGSLLRFDAAFFPVMLVLALVGRRAALERGITAVGMGFGAVLMALFAQWYWVA